MKIKLSDAQKKVIQLMRNGYEAGHSGGFFHNTWLQLGGCGRGGKSEGLNLNTLYSLVDKKVVQVKPNQPQFKNPCIYELTELGKTIEL